MNSKQTRTFKRNFFRVIETIPSDIEHRVNGISRRKARLKVKKLFQHCGTRFS